MAKPNLYELYIMLKSLHAACKRASVFPLPSVTLQGDGQCSVTHKGVETLYASHLLAAAALDDMNTELQNENKTCATCGGLKKLIAAVDAFAHTAYLDPCPTCSADTVKPKPTHTAIIGVSDPGRAALFRDWETGMNNPDGYRYAAPQRPVRV